MTRYYLSKLTIEGFRGINNEGDPFEITFKPGVVNSVFAYNGAGKSSISEALCYAIRGTIPKLSELQVQERADEYFANKFHSKGVAIIELELQPDDPVSEQVIVRVQRTQSGKRIVTSPSGHANPEAFLASLDEDFTLLDYRRFTRFIDDTPLVRGRSFSTLLGVSNYADFQQTLQMVSDSRVLDNDLELSVLQTEAKAKQDAADAIFRTLASSYKSLIGDQIAGSSEMDACCEKVLAALRGIDLVAPHIGQLEPGEIDFEAIKKAIADAEGGPKRDELANVLKDISELEGLTVGEPDITNSEVAALQGLAEERQIHLDATKGELYHQLHNAAKKLLDADEWSLDTICPLCESEITIDLLDFVNSQLTKYKSVQEKSSELQDAWARSSWTGQLVAMENSKILNIAKNNRLSANFHTRVVKGELSRSDIDYAFTKFNEYEDKRKTSLEALKLRKSVLETELPPSLVQLTHQVEYGRQFCQSIGEFREKTTQAVEALTKHQVRNRWKTFIVKATNAFALAETSLSKKKITAIDSNYKEMFKRVTSSSDIEPDLQRSDQRQALSVQLSNFYGHSGLSAQALLSESYRNALAISVFLSAAMNHTGVPRFVVLDDVTSSFDAGHQWKLMEEIRLRMQQPRVTNGLQFILLSHDGLLEKYFDSLGNTADWHHQRLLGSPPMGAIMTQAQDADRLKGSAYRLLSAGQVAEAAPLVRQYLEYKLMQVITKVSIPVPLDFAMKDHNKMVSNCLSAITDAIELNKKASILVLDNKQQDDLKNILIPCLVGNWISHYETASAVAIAPPVLQSVLIAIDAFTECFRYDDPTGGGNTRKWYRSLSKR